mgnify:CR=1 FL=1
MEIKRIQQQNYKVVKLIGDYTQKWYSIAIYIFILNLQKQ